MQGGKGFVGHGTYRVNAKMGLRAWCLEVSVRFAKHAHTRVPAVGFRVMSDSECRMARPEPDTLRASPL